MPGKILTLAFVVVQLGDERRQVEASRGDGVVHLTAGHQLQLVAGSVHNLTHLSGLHVWSLLLWTKFWDES